MNLKSLVAVVAVLGSGAALVPTAYAVPLGIGAQVEVTDQNGNAFTPSPVPANADGLHANVTFSLNGGGNQGAAAGLFSLNMRAWGSTGAYSQLLAFCLEPDVFLTPFSNPYTVNALGAAGYPSALISELWGRYRYGVNSDVTAAAFQVALWELAYGTTDLNLSTGAFRLTSGGAVQTTAQNWLSSLNGTGPMTGGLIVLVNNQQLADRQDLILEVPEPATLALLGLGLAGIGAARRRRRR